jgi:hypothetical protein
VCAGVQKLTGAAGDDALPSLLLGETGHKVVSAANFKAEDFMKIFALEINLVAEFCAEIRCMYEWCLFEDFVHL